MKNAVLRQDKYILESFLENRIPSYVREKTICDYDLMEYYEELFNYTHNLLSGHKVDLKVNSLGTGKAFAFNEKYKNILLDISNKTEDIDLMIHCQLCLATLLVIQKYACM